MVENADVPCLVSSSSRKPSDLPGNAARASHPSTGRPSLRGYPRYVCEVKTFEYFDLNKKKEQLTSQCFIHFLSSVSARTDTSHPTV